MERGSADETVVVLRVRVADSTHEVAYGLELAIIVEDLGAAIFIERSGVIVFAYEAVVRAGIDTEDTVLGGVAVEAKSHEEAESEVGRTEVVIETCLVPHSYEDVLGGKFGIETDGSAEVLGEFLERGVLLESFKLEVHSLSFC
jgi:hypothetical protein